jgi:hypothetical protein
MTKLLDAAKQQFAPLGGKEKEKELTEGDVWGCDCSYRIHVPQFRCRSAERV